MNGIAYDSATGKVLITGKLWPDVYEIDFQK
ncbi:glutaminyl-peptide cyclotransferase [Niabella hibiscisoli]